MRRSPPCESWVSRSSSPSLISTWSREADGGPTTTPTATSCPGSTPTRTGLPAEIARKQADQYADLFRLFHENSDIIARVSFWNLHDGESWLNDFPWKRVNHPLLFDRQLRPKPAFDAVYSTLKTPRTVHTPVERRDPKSQLAHQQLVAKAKQGTIDLYFEGDSITRRWGATDYPKFLAHWQQHFHGWNAANFGWGGDTTHNILWRLQNGEFDGVSPKVIVLQAGTNNLPWNGPADATVGADVVGGITAILATFREKAPGATIVLTALFPRPQNKALAPDHRRDQRPVGEAGRRQARPVRQHQREVNRRRRQPPSRDLDRRRASRGGRLRRLGRGLEAHLHRVARTSRLDRQGTATHRRPWSRSLIDTGRPIAHRARASGVALSGFRPDPSEPSSHRDDHLFFLSRLPSISHSCFWPPKSASAFPLKASPSIVRV